MRQTSHSQTMEYACIYGCLRGNQFDVVAATPVHRTCGRGSLPMQDAHSELASTGWIPARLAPPGSTGRFLSRTLASGAMVTGRVRMLGLALLAACYLGGCAAPD